MDAITNKGTRTFPMDDATFNSLLLPVEYIKKLTEDEFHAFMSAHRRYHDKIFYEHQNQKKINEFCTYMSRDSKFTPEEIKCRLFGDMSNNS